MNPDSIQVAIRVRPLSQTEINSGFQNIIKKITDEPQILVGGARNGASLFTFNHVFNENDSQETVYSNSVQHMIKKLFEGYNVTILAYGQTGSGKTYTMDTNYNGIPSDLMGIIPRAMLEIFENVASLKAKHNISIKCSFVELYNERLFDLLSKATNRNDCIVDIREDSAKCIIIPGLTDIKVNSIDEVINCLVRGSSGRAVGVTAMNETSSRSHAIFTVTIEVAKKNNPRKKTLSRFHLVDLAGSERTKKTKATGNRLKEGILINQGLFALGKCITALGDPNSNNFVPYRESKLTRLLQDSLGGNSVTLLIACVSPADFNMDESLNTLNYANRAKNITNKPIINDDSTEMELENWEQKAQALRLEILNLENMSCVSVDQYGNVSIVEMKSISMLTSELKAAQLHNQELQTKLRYAMTSLLNFELKDDLIENTYNELIELVNNINCNTIRLMEIEICETSMPTLIYMDKIQKLAGEMKTLLQSVVNEVHNSNENGDSRVEPNVNYTLDYSDVCSEMDLENFHKKQFSFTNEIQQLSQQISIKEGLQKQILANLPSFLADNSNIYEKLIEFENKIKILEMERIDLESLLLMTNKTSTASQKVADERQNKIGSLVKQLESLVKQHKQQHKLLELRETDGQRITQLQNEISELKATRLRTTRELQKCKKLHKKWTLSKNMEINKIRGLETKKKCEMSKMSISNKQRQTVLKQRIAEAFASIKILEMKIEKKRLAQFGRRRESKVDSFKNDVDVILGITETETSLDHIKQNRERIISVIELLKQEKPMRPQEIASAENQLKQLNKQLANYHQTIISAKKDDKIKKLIDGSGSVEEEREIVKCLFGEILYLTKETSEKNAEYNMIMKSNEAVLNKVSRLETKQTSIKQKFLSDLNFIERRNEEKIGELLRDLQVGGGDRLGTRNKSSREKLMEETRKTKTQYLKIQRDLELENDQLLKQLRCLQQEEAEKAAKLSIYSKGDVGIAVEDNNQNVCKLEEETATSSSRLTRPLNKRQILGELLKCCCTSSSSSNVADVENVPNNDNKIGENNRNRKNIWSKINIRNLEECIGDEIKPKNEQSSSGHKFDVTIPCYPYALKKRTPFYRESYN